VKLLVLLTKADKLNRQEQQASMAKAQAELGERVTDESDVSLMLFSALKKTGVDDLAQTLHAWTTQK
jgi:GTP-binding protein